jgi:hypothetical protein
VSTRERIEWALTLSEAELFQHIGAYSYVLDGDVVLKKAFGDRDRNEKHGRGVFEHLRPEIERIVCQEWGACKRLAQFPDETALAVAVADTLVRTPRTIAESRSVGCVGLTQGAGIPD